MLQESIEVRRGTWRMTITLVDPAVKRPPLFLVKPSTADPGYDSQTTRVVQRPLLLMSKTTQQPLVIIHSQHEQFV